MNQVTVFEKNISVPAHLAARIGAGSKMADDLLSGIAGDPVNRLGIRASRFRVNINGKEATLKTLELDVVVIGARSGLAKSYFSKEFDEESKNDSPDCFSFDGKAPHSSVPAPMCQSCVACPMNKFGSKITKQGKEAKACSDSKRLAVMLADLPEEGPLLLSISPTSLKPLSQYTAELRKRGIPPECIRTTLSFDPDVSYPKLNFTFGGFLTEEEQAKVDAYIGTDTVARIVGYDETEIPADTPKAPAPSYIPIQQVSEPAPVKKPVLVEEPPVIEETSYIEVPKAEAKPKAKPAAKPVVLEDDGADSLTARLSAAFGN